MMLFLLPQSDYDPTECSVPWQALRRAGITVCFATPQGMPAYADSRLVDIGFGPLNAMLMTRKPDLEHYRSMIRDEAFLSPIAFADVKPEQYEGLVIPGGHAPGMRSLLESELAQHIVLHFFNANKLVSAVCHGPLLLARTIDPSTGRSVLHGRKMTALLAKTMELPAWIVTAPWLGRYYRTYPQTVEEEVKAALASPGDFLPGPALFKRDSAANPQNGFVVRDRNLLTARWPGDCYRFANALVEMVSQAFRSNTPPARL